MSDKNAYDVIEENGFEVRNLIGMGGFSLCYKVFSRQYKNYFVCKVISLEGQKCEARKKSFQNEINALGNIIHPNIIHIYKTFLKYHQHF